MTAEASGVSTHAEHPVHLHDGCDHPRNTNQKDGQDKSKDTIEGFSLADHFDGAARQAFAAVLRT